MKRCVSPGRRDVPCGTARKKQLFRLRIAIREQRGRE
jgi:hypothetical protein